MEEVREEKTFFEEHKKTILATGVVAVTGLCCYMIGLNTGADRMGEACKALEDAGYLRRTIPVQPVKLATDDAQWAKGAEKVLKNHFNLK